MLPDTKLHVECFVCGVCGEAIKGRFFRDQETGGFRCSYDYKVT